MKVFLIEDDQFPKEKILEFLSAEEKNPDAGKLEIINSSNPNPKMDELLDRLEKEYLSNHKTETRTSDNHVVIIIKSGVPKALSEIPNTSNLTVETPSFKSDTVEYKQIRISIENEEVYFNNKRIRLTALEFKLLLFFISNPKRLITRKMIIDYIWGKTEHTSKTDTAIYTHIKNLKKKMAHSGAGNFIHSVYGQGYKFSDMEEDII